MEEEEHELLSEEDIIELFGEKRNTLFRCSNASADDVEIKREGDEEWMEFK